MKIQFSAWTARCENASRATKRSYSSIAVWMGRQSNGSKNVIICENSSMGNCTWEKKRERVRMIVQRHENAAKERKCDRMREQRGVITLRESKNAIWYQRSGACECGGRYKAAKMWSNARTVTCGSTAREWKCDIIRVEQRVWMLKAWKSREMQSYGITAAWRNAESKSTKNAIICENSGERMLGESKVRENASLCKRSGAPEC